MFKYGYELVEYCEKEKKCISTVALEEEAQQGDCTVQDVLDELNKRVDIMNAACIRTLLEPTPSVSGLTGGDANRLYKYRKSSDTLMGETALLGVDLALSCFEVNTSMGAIVACPTAGSCGIVPGALFAVAKKKNLNREALLHAFATAGYIGMIIAGNATVAGAEGGCQAECGSASAMAAAAIVQMCGGTPAQSLSAAAIALKNVMGLVCDPVAGLVEIPCAKRNASGVTNAILSAELVLAGIDSMIPFDEVVGAMYKVGRMLPEELRETARGGVAVTKTGLEYKKRVFGE